MSSTSSHSAGCACKPSYARTTPSSYTPLHPLTPPYTPYTPLHPLTPIYRYIRDFWNQLDTGTFLMIMAAAAVRINNATREEEWEGSFVDVLPRNI